MAAAQDELTLWAPALAARCLDVPEFRNTRWRHVQAVAGKADQLAPAYGPDGWLLVASAWLHDIGYAWRIARTGAAELLESVEPQDQAENESDDPNSVG